MLADITAVENMLKSSHMLHTRVRFITASTNLL
jgi:hypothetical protein